MRETDISRERALAILTIYGQAGAYDQITDWYIVTTEDGAEELWRYGDDAPFVTNRTTTSWLGSGMPK